MKATIKVLGNVQAVGYRALVKIVARTMGVKGLIRNLDDGSVEIFAETPEDALNRFLKAIDIKGRPGDILSLHVEEIKVSREGEPGYQGPWRSYGVFEIDYGEEKPRPIEKDMAESLEWAKLYFTKLVSEFSGFKGEFGDFREEFKDFRGEFKEFREEFGDFRGEFRDFREEFKDFRGEFKDFREEFRDYRGEFREFRDESLKLSREILGEVKELRKDLKTILDERLQRMERDIAEIKAKLGLL